MFSKNKFSSQNLSPFFTHAKRAKIHTRFNLTTLIATWFYVGKIPFMPGTLASIAVYPLYHFMVISSESLAEVSCSLVVSAIILFFLGWLSVHRFQKETGSFDSQMVVIDEVVGQTLTIALAYQWLYSISTYLFLIIPFITLSPLVLTFVIALFVFRFFDIKKPFMIRYIDRNYKNAFGVILDDVLAALFAAGSIYIAFVIVEAIRY